MPPRLPTTHVPRLLCKQMAHVITEVVLRTEVFLDFGFAPLRPPSCQADDPRTGGQHEAGRGMYHHDQSPGCLFENTRIICRWCRAGHGYGCVCYFETTISTTANINYACLCNCFFLRPGDKPTHHHRQGQCQRCRYQCQPCSPTAILG